MLPNIARSSRVQIILASSRHDDRDALEAALAGTPWELILAANQQDASYCVHQAYIPIVLCDLSFDNLPWRNMLRGLLRARRRARVILLADDDNRALATDLVRAGGFDMLTRPFEPDQVFATLISAYTQCGVNVVSNARNPEAALVSV
jgi:DNA-binding NtrC family response regulator